MGTGRKRRGEAGRGVGVLKRGIDQSLEGCEKGNLLEKGKSSGRWREWRLELWGSVILLWVGWAVLPWEVLRVVTKWGGSETPPMCWEGWDGEF